ncbi:hypothetical protein SAMN05421819_0244 [Bryocella elongata]|uniref:Uncharacterized protein n=1 Tax=Bryocella elongata TaxID=863522 RepID=A0A1H5SMS4_9BACT|nr:hypothetical protein SAMN05421819_0244 [Bryocella elongata]
MDMGHPDASIPRLLSWNGRVTRDTFLLRKQDEFHEEWLRDEPFDATTTGQLVGTGVNSLPSDRGT